MPRCRSPSGIYIADSQRRGAAMDAATINFGPLPAAAPPLPINPATLAPPCIEREAEATGRPEDDGLPTGPPEPASLAELGISVAEVESLVLKVLLQRGA